jgi:hypothetical protein
MRGNTVFSGVGARGASYNPGGFGASKERHTAESDGAAETDKPSKGHFMRTLVNLAASAILLAAATTAQADCFRCAPILNIANAPVESASGKPLTEDQIKTAIIRAGATLGWKMRDEGPGKIIASIALRKHMATVEIPYSTKEYSITYKDSVNLDAIGDGTIHKNYNGWIENLSRAIKAQISAAEV